MHGNLEHIRCSLWLLHFDDPKQFDGKSHAVRCSRTIPKNLRYLEIMIPDRSVSVVHSYGCVWKWLVPHCTQWFCWSLSLWKIAISLGIYPKFSDKPIWLFILIRFHEGRSWYTVGVWGNINHDIPVICRMFGQTWTHTFRMDWNHYKVGPPSYLGSW